ncbi:MAG: relaxase/mobilization nuclease domain-containing protein [Clostridia bacterium]|nr:relaxase/mobilization nuclease domain-containing protein [Clostridia bacterium]
MATFKHISSKNADYSAAEKYLTFEHDEIRMKPMRDEKGRLIPRENFRFSTLNCGGDNFAIACLRANKRFRKNLNRGEIKSQHYIISFDPKDGPDHGLTVDKAQEMGEQFCRDNFAGHQAIVCTHADGHNHSGNIHVHIVINSLRIEDAPQKTYMDRPADWKAGTKHRCTDAAMNHYKSEVMRMCEQEGLYQIDLLNGSPEKITDAEYWAKRRGQQRADAEHPGTKFQTDLEKLRLSIRNAMAVAKTFEEFEELLLTAGITVKESRGRYSYLPEGRKKPITARRLGYDFEKALILAKLAENEAHSKEKEEEIIIPDLPEEAKELMWILDRDKLREQGKGTGYLRWASIHNIKAMSQTLDVLRKAGLMDMRKLEETYNAASRAFSESQTKIKSIESRIVERKELQTQVRAYARTQETREQYAKLRTDKQRQRFREEHQSDFILMNAARKYFQEHGYDPIPKAKEIKAELDRLYAEKNAKYEEYKERREAYQKLSRLRQNIRQVMGEPEQERKKETPTKS